MKLHKNILSFLFFFFFSARVVAQNKFVPKLRFENNEVESVSTGMGFFDGILNADILGIYIWRFLAFFLLIGIGWIVKRYVLRLIFGKAEDALSKTKTEWDNKILKAVEAPLGYIFLTIVLGFGILFLRLPQDILHYIALALRTIGAILATWIVLRMINVFHEMMLSRFTRVESKMDQHLFQLVKRILRVIVVIVMVLTILQQWGYQITSLIAGLGIGGLAVSLAAQDTLANWFGSMMIFTDRPFGVGDWVKTKDGEGIVEDVGLRSTRVKTFEQTLITIPNRTIAADSIENISSRNKRRFKTILGLEYRTSRTQMEKVLLDIRNYLETDSIFDRDSIHVSFTGFGDSALEVLVYVFINTTDYGLFLETQQALLLEIMKVVEEAGSAFAFPSQSIYMES